MNAKKEIKIHDTEKARQPKRKIIIEKGIILYWSLIDEKIKKQGLRIEDFFGII